MEFSHSQLVAKFSRVRARPRQDFHPVIRKSIELVERAFAWANRRQRVEPPPGIVKVNLGSGLFVAPGWINIDGSLKTAFARWPRSVLSVVYSFTGGGSHSREEFIDILRSNRFVMHNLKYGVPLHSDSVDYVFSSHVLHHLYKDEAWALLLDIHRALKPGGTIRIAVPDLEYIIALYLQGRREEAVEKYFFYPSAARGELSTRHYQYDFALLSKLLETAGFTNVRKCICYEGDTPDLETLDRLSHESLYVEASKPLERMQEAS